MKRLLTYGLLLLTILASHFVVSACQDDLPETTEVMLTFTTRADLSFEDDEDATDSNLQDVDRMKDLRVIMLDGDNKVVGNAIEENINKSSVVFKFSTPASHGEVFKFLAIANEKSIGLGNELNDIVDEQDFSNYETEWKKREINSTLNPTADNPLPQTKFWTWTYSVFGDGGEDLNPVLDYVGCKISVVFNNMTKEVQSLSNIHITGITPNTQGYLFKQDGTDYIDSKDATPISWDEVLTLAAPTTGDDDETIYASDSVAYYTYPLAASNFDSPKLYATWGDDTRELDLSGITSLKRNEHLRIEITLTPAGDITVNYTIAEWEDTPTNIGDKAPTTPGNGYNTENWGASNDIEIGGDEDDPWSNLGGAIIAGGKDVFENWEELEGLGKTNWLPIDIKASYLVPGYKIAVGFTIDSETIKVVDFYFRTPWNNIISGPITYEGDGEIIATLLLDNTSIEMIKEQQNGSPDEVRTAYHLIAVTFKEGSTQDAHNVTLTRMAIVDTNKK